MTAKEMSSESRAIADAEHADADDSEDSSEDEDFVIGADEAGDDSGNSDSSDDEATASKRKKRARRGKFLEHVSAKLIFKRIRLLIFLFGVRELDDGR